MITKAISKRIRRRVHDHTRRVFENYSTMDLGYGTDGGARCAIDSAERLCGFIEQLLGGVGDADAVLERGSISARAGVEGLE